jgi:Ca2+-binding EF-hand superfamily protein
MTGRFDGVALALFATSALIAAPAAAQQQEAMTGCAADFAMADADDDGRITKDEADAFTEERFAALDADGDGEITQQEYGRCLQTRTENVMNRVLAGPSGMARAERERMRMAMSGEAGRPGRGGLAAAVPQGQSDMYDSTGRMRDAVFEAIDADKDGTIERKEWASAASAAYDPWTSDAAAGREPGAQAQMQKTAEEHDVNPREFGRALRAYIMSPPVPSVLKDRFGRAGDRSVERMTPEQAGEAARMTFDEIDRDRSGGISMAEWSGSHPILGRRGALGSFDELDLNGDGRVTATEYDQVQDEKFGEMTTQTPEGDGRGVPLMIYRLYVL